jgi:hypothetical protein
MNCPTCGSSDAYQGFFVVECINVKCVHYKPYSGKLVDVEKLAWFIKPSKDPDSEQLCYFVDNNNGKGDRTIFGISYDKKSDYVRAVFVSADGRLYHGKTANLPNFRQAPEKSRWNFVGKITMSEFMAQHVAKIISVLSEKNWCR